MEGVKAILLGKELPITFGILPVSQDEHTLAIDIVRYVGDPVVAVAAVDEETAEEAVRRIKVDYEDLPPVMSIADGVQPARRRSSPTPNKETFTNPSRSNSAIRLPL